MGHLIKVCLPIMLSTRYCLVFLALAGLALASSIEDEGCAKTVGCNDNVKCCNSHFKCVRGPNQVNGTCAPWLPLRGVEDCVVSRGCQKPSDCCNKQFTCAHFEVQSEGVCMPWLQQDSEDLSPVGKKEGNCVADFEKGCVHVDGSDCCNDDFMCINGVCRNWVPILERTTRRITPRRTTPRRTTPRRTTPRKTTRRPSRRTTRRHRIFAHEANLGCPKCKTVADCPKYAHCGFNGCCQFW